MTAPGIPGPYGGEDAKARLVVLVSGAGTNLQALLDACADSAYGAAVVAVGADRTGIEGLARARRAGVPAFTHRVPDHPSRAAWNDALTQSCAGYRPDVVISAGFMKLVGPAFLGRFAGRFVNTHPSLLPAFPGMHAVRDALAYGGQGDRLHRLPRRCGHRHRPGDRAGGGAGPRG